MMLKTQNASYQVKNKTLIHPVTAEFLPGKMYGILGLNGSGKTTFLKMLGGIYRPSKGQILWSEKSLLSYERHHMSRIISYVPQSPQVVFDFNVFKFVALGRYCHHRSSRLTPSDLLVIEKTLSLVDCAHLKDRRISELSGGERQRIFIARSLASESNIILLDEPSANLDIKHKLEIWGLLQTLAKEGKTIITSAHDLFLCMQFCNEILVLDSGKKIQSGPPQLVLTNSLLQSVFGISSLNIHPY